MPDSASPSEIDFRQLFAVVPGLYIVVVPDLIVVAVTDGYLRATMKNRDEIVGRNIFDVFPDNPDDGESHSSANVRASFEKVFETGEPDTLPVQKYDVERPDGKFEERYWKLMSFPIFDDKGAVSCVMHRVEDITRQIILERKGVEQELIASELYNRAAQSESERRLAESALEDARLRLEAALEVGEIGTWTFDIVNDRVFADKSLAKIFSVSPGAAAGGAIKNYLQAIHADDRQRVERIIADAIKNSDNYTAEYRVVQPDGTSRWVIARGKIIRDEDGRAVQLPGVVIDITEQQQAREKLLEQTQMATLYGDIGAALNLDEDLRSVLRRCTDALVEHLGVAFARIWTHNESENTLELEASSGLYTHLDGAHSRVPVGKFKIGLIAEERKPHLTNEVLSDERVSDKEWAKREGMIAFAGYPLILEDRLVGVMSAFARKPLTNVTLQAMESVSNAIANGIERKKSEAALRESELQLRTLADAVPQLVWMAEADGFIFWYNERWYSYTGTAPKDMEGWGWQSVHDPEILPQVMERWTQSIATGKKFEMEFPLRGADGKFRWFLTRVNPLRDSQNRIVRWFGTNTDIDDQRSAAKERERLLESEQAARAEAENANRLKDDFLATLSHELRTPLTSILGWSRMLGAGQLDGEQASRALETIERNAKAQSQLIEDVLDVSRIVSGKMRLNVRLVDLFEVIETAIDAVRPAADAKNIRLQRILDSNVGKISGDSDRLQQIIWNLLSNAIKFTPKGGRVQIKLERVNSHVELVVADNGQGIDPEVLPFIFERFRQSDSTTTRAHGGLGLGLAIVRHLVELHGGSVAAASSGQGSTFTVCFPLAALGEEKIKSEAEPERDKKTDKDIKFYCPPELKAVRILVVDDERDARALLTSIFESCEASVSQASNVDEALEAIKTNEFDVLVSDIGMPGRDGYDLIEQVRKLSIENGGRIPALALTAYARLEDRMRVLSAGFQMHVPKPVEPAELLTIVANLVNWKNHK
ncbi:MAG: PAS domain-containing protein [Acidobacteriota bacterium]|nr:PAS domain-containing protein [Acidobacteriota bacterium]